MPRRYGAAMMHLRLRMALRTHPVGYGSWAPSLGQEGCCLWESMTGAEDGDRVTGMGCRVMRACGRRFTV